MAVTIEQAPGALHFSRNAVDVSFDTDKIITYGAENETRFKFNTLPTVNGVSLDFSFDLDGETIDITFIFSDDPDPEAYEVPLYAGGDELEWMANVVVAMMSHPDISAHFNVAAGQLDADPNNYIFVNSIEKLDTNIDIDATGFTITFTTARVGSAQEAEEEYRSSVWLYVGNTAQSDPLDMYRTKEIELDANEAGLVYINVKKYLADLLFETEPLTASTTDLVLCTKINRPAFLLFGQKWGSPYERQKQGLTPIFRVLKGGLEPRDYAEKKATLETWLTGQFLSIRKSRRVRTDQPDWLFWYAKDTLEDVKVMVQFFHVSATTDEAVAITASVEAGQTYQFRCDPEALAALWPLPLLASLVKYEVWIQNAADEILTEKMEFIIDEDHMDVVFIYESSMGGSRETWKMTGPRQLVQQISKANYRTELPFNATAADIDLKSYNELNATTLHCSTGPMTLQESRAYADFLLSRNILLVAGDHRIPVRIPNGEAIAQTWNREGNYARGGDFVAELGVSENVSTVVL